MNIKKTKSSLKHSSDDFTKTMNEYKKFMATSVSSLYDDPAKEKMYEKVAFKIYHPKYKESPALQETVIPAFTKALEYLKNATPDKSAEVEDLKLSFDHVVNMIKSKSLDLKNRDINNDKFKCSLVGKEQEETAAEFLIKQLEEQHKAFADLHDEFVKKCN